MATKGDFRMRPPVGPGPQGGHDRHGKPGERARRDNPPRARSLARARSRRASMQFRRKQREEEGRGPSRAPSASGSATGRRRRRRCGCRAPAARLPESSVAVANAWSPMCWRLRGSSPADIVARAVVARLVADHREIEGEPAALLVVDRCSSVSLGISRAMSVDMLLATGRRTAWPNTEIAGPFG